MTIKSILVKLENGEEVILNITVPANTDTFNYVCKFLDQNVPTAVEWE